VSPRQGKVSSHIAYFGIAVCRLWQRAWQIRIKFKIGCKWSCIFRVTFNYCARGFVIFILNCSGSLVSFCW
jgi:hypothetical protein